MKTRNNLPIENDNVNNEVSKENKYLPDNYHSRIKELRIKRDKELKEKHIGKLTQENMTDYLQCSLRTYQDYENDKILPSMYIAIELSRFYGVSIDYLLGFTEYTHIGNKEIHEITGLSDNAINKLRTMAAHDKCLIESNNKNQKRIAAKKDKSSVRPLLLPLYTDTVNFLIESKLFFNLISTLSYFLNSDKFSKFLDSHFKKIDTDSLYPADENYICGSFDIPINSDTQKALAKNLLDVQLNKLSEEFKKKAAAKNKKTDPFCF